MRILLMPSRRSAFLFDTVWRNVSPCTRNLVSSTSLFGPEGTNRDVAKLPPGGPGTKATEQQLIQVKEAMTEQLPTFTWKTHNFSAYHPNVEFEDNIRHVRTSGLVSYYLQVTQARTYCLIRFTKNTLTVLKATHDTQDSKVCIRWTFEGHYLLNVVNYFIRYVAKGTKMPPSRVIDGFSIMYVGADGRIWKHVIEKMIPDTDSELKTDPSSPLISTKLQGASLTLDPKP